MMDEKEELLDKIEKLESQVAWRDEEISQLNNQVADLRDELELLTKSDWFAPRETFAETYAKLHPEWPSKRGTNPRWQELWPPSTT